MALAKKLSPNGCERAGGREDRWLSIWRCGRAISAWRRASGKVLAFM